MTDKHSNPSILKEMEKSDKLSKAIQKYTASALQDIAQTFKSQFGFDPPSAKEALLLMQDSTVQYADAPDISEFLEGLQTAIQGAIGQDYPQVAKGAVQVLGGVINGLIGSDQIGSTNEFESTKQEENGKKIFSVLNVQSSTISAKDFGLSKDFTLSAYMLIIFKSS
jgi:hypothetical protein